MFVSVNGTESSECPMEKDHEENPPSSGEIFGSEWLTQLYIHNFLCNNALIFYI